MKQSGDCKNHHQTDKLLFELKEQIAIISLYVIQQMSLTMKCSY